MSDFSSTYSFRPARRAAFAALFAVVSTTGCQRSAGDTDLIVTIDGDEVHYHEFESHLRDSVEAKDFPLEPVVLEQLFDQYLDERLIVRFAFERGLEGTYDTVDQRMALRHLLRRAEKPALPQTEIEAYYAAHAEDYRRPERVRLQQILVDDRGKAESAHAALEKGDDFAQVAARFSQVPATYLNDDSGLMAREDLPAAFADSIFELEPGEISEIIAADYGFHIFQVDERFPIEEVPLEAASPEIRRILERRRLDDLIASFLEEARGRYNVRIHLPNFPFEYRGSYAQSDDI